jgi:hypothetical protein
MPMRASSTEMSLSSGPVAMRWMMERTHQPALRHQEGRRSAQPRRLLHHRRHLQQAARLRRAHRPRAQARRARRRRRAGQRAVRGQHRSTLAHLADGTVRPAHHPAPAHRHLLRPGRQDQRAVLHPRPERPRQHPSRLGLRPARQHARLRQDPAPDRRGLRRLRGRLRRDPYGKAERTELDQSGGDAGRFRRFTREQIADRNDNLDIAWLRDEEGDAEERLDDPEDIAAAIIGHLRAALEEIEGICSSARAGSLDVPRSGAEGRRRSHIRRRSTGFVPGPAYRPSILPTSCVMRRIPTSYPPC